MNRLQKPIAGKLSRPQKSCVRFGIGSGPASSREFHSTCRVLLFVPGRLALVTVVGTVALDELIHVGSGDTRAHCSGKWLGCAAPGALKFLIDDEAAAAAIVAMPAGRSRPHLSISSEFMRLRSRTSVDCKLHFVVSCSVRHRVRRLVRSEGGFSLIETLVAVTLLVVGVGALAQLFVISTRANGRARSISTASLLAQAKTEQLRALTWGFDPFGLPVSDTTSDTRVEPEQSTGGTGLSVSPPDTLARNVAGYCDFVDATGRLLGDPANDARVPAAAIYVRRWSVDPLPADPGNTIVIQVLVMPATTERSGESARLVSVRTRRGTQ